MAANSKRISKYLSFILRHSPQAIGLTLDTHGWASVDELTHFGEGKLLSIVTLKTRLLLAVVTAVSR